jgi:hypothetical protein
MSVGEVLFMVGECHFFGVCCASGIKLYLFWRGMVVVLSCCPPCRFVCQHLRRQSRLGPRASLIAHPALGRMRTESRNAIAEHTKS